MLPFRASRTFMVHAGRSVLGNIPQIGRSRMHHWRTLVWVNGFRVDRLCSFRAWRNQRRRAKGLFIRTPQTGIDTVRRWTGRTKPLSGPRMNSNRLNIHTEVEVLNTKCAVIRDTRDTYSDTGTRWSHWILKTMPRGRILSLTSLTGALSSVVTNLISSA